MSRNWIRRFSEISIDDVPSAGGKNAALGEMFCQLTSMGVKAPDGFATTADAYRDFLSVTGLDQRIRSLISQRRLAHSQFPRPDQLTEVLQGPVRRVARP